MITLLQLIVIDCLLCEGTELSTLQALYYLLLTTTQCDSYKNYPYFKVRSLKLKQINQTHGEHMFQPALVSEKKRSY